MKAGRQRRTTETEAVRSGLQKRQTHRETGRERHAGRQACGQADRNRGYAIWFARESDRQTEKERHEGRQACGQADRDRDYRQTETTETEAVRSGLQEKETDTQRDREA